MMLNIDDEMLLRKNGWCRECGLPFGLVNRPSNIPDSEFCEECVDGFPLGQVEKEIERLDSQIRDFNHEIERLEDEISAIEGNRDEVISAREKLEMRLKDALKRRERQC